MSEKTRKVKGVHRLTIGEKTVSDSKDIPIIIVNLITGEIRKEKEAE